MGERENGRAPSGKQNYFPVSIELNETTAEKDIKKKKIKLKILKNWVNCLNRRITMRYIKKHYFLLLFVLSLIVSINGEASGRTPALYGYVRLANVSTRICSSWGCGSRITFS